jgi:hypothetical protein
MAAVLYYGVDDRLNVILENFFTIRKQDAGEIHSITKITDPKKFDEALVGVNFDIMFIEQAFLSKSALEWIATFKLKFARVQCPIILVGDEHDPVKVLKFIESGFKDYIVNPPDKPLIIEKFVMYSTGKRNNEVRQVYSLQLSQSLDLAKSGFLEELSEFDCKVRCAQPIPLDDLILLYAPAFSEKGDVKATAVGRCYGCFEHQSFKGQYLVQFFFVGVTPDVLTNIRNALRKSYVANKQK